LFDFEQRDFGPAVRLMGGVLWACAMLHLVETDRTYPPETLAAMSAAFERVCQSMSVLINGNEIVRDKLVACNVYEFCSSRARADPCGSRSSVDARGVLSSVDARGVLSSVGA
jgi:hypothetical protein